MDRVFTAVSWKRYLNLSLKFYKRLVIIVSVLSTAECMLLWTTAAITLKNGGITSLCTYGEVAGKTHRKMHLFYMIFTGYMSFSLCFVAVVIMRIKLSYREQMPLQNSSFQLTKAVVIMMAIFVITHVLPLSLYYVVRLRREQYHIFDRYVWVVSSFSLCITSFVYLFLNPSMRRALPVIRFRKYCQRQRVASVTLAATTTEAVVP
ncbi:unnamed protein product [Soboliphyme baturini]|uniref:G_PROTEIN_RECEP_F1_2 domain-containing protein n=1 Tax=Soboliphyme baturini TaxID=241478 RepID=A0A183J4Z7_9BILA|nr:unnamed protein product [Soboliphyme baturini]